MAFSADYCFTAMTDWEQTQCNNYRKGGISAIAFVETDQTFSDITDASEWNTKISAGDVKVIKNLSAEWPAGSTQTIDNPAACGSTTLPVSRDFTITVEDPNVSSTNDASWANVDGRTLYVAVYLCNDDEIRYVNTPVTVDAPPANVPGGRNDIHKYTVTLSWSDDLGVTYTLSDAPTGIFS